MPVWIFEYQLYNTIYTYFSSMFFKYVYIKCDNIYRNGFLTLLHILFFFLFACLVQTIRRKIKQQQLVNSVYII